MSIQLPHRRAPRLTVLAGAVVAALLAAIAVVPAQAAEPAPVAAQSSPAAPTGWLRVGHLAPAVPAVDVAISEFGGPERTVVPKAGYGAVTPYKTLKPGTYTIAMRPAGAPQSAPPVLNQAVDIAAGSAMTVLVFGIGPGGAPEARLTADDLTAPPAGMGRVRLVQGAAELPPVEVTPVGGSGPLASDLAYGSTTPYATVPEGRWTLQMRAGDKLTDGTVDVRGGSSSTVVIVAGAAGPELRPLVDSMPAAAAATGGVETGAGGTASAR